MNAPLPSSPSSSPASAAPASASRLAGHALVEALTGAHRGAIEAGGLDGALGQAGGQQLEAGAGDHPQADAHHGQA